MDAKQLMEKVAFNRMVKSAYQAGFEDGMAKEASMYAPPKGIIGKVQHKLGFGPVSYWDTPSKQQQMLNTGIALVKSPGMREAAKLVAAPSRIILIR